MAVKIKKGEALMTLTMTPLIDMVFNLLIFFLVASRFAEEEREIPVSLPDASEAVPLTVQPQELFINIDSRGQYFVTGKVVGVDELLEICRRKANANPGRASAIIRADRDCRWQPIVAAMNLCKKAGIRQYHATTRDQTGQSEGRRDHGPPNEAPAAPQDPSGSG
jgi:biopolymer transport protein ExbD